LAHNFQS